MIARVTLAEIDTLRTNVRRAVGVFESSVLPELREQRGYEGCTVLTTPEGKALVATFWQTPEDADASVESGSYGAQVEKFVTVMAAPPGRDTYEVTLRDEP